MRSLISTRLRRASWLVSILAVLAIVSSINPSAALADQRQAPGGAAFVQTNDIFGNAILAYARSDDGGLTLVGRYPTSGLGGTQVGAPTDPLSSQNSLTYDRDHHLLYAVNAGSDSVSVFGVWGTHLRLFQVVASDGQFPTSVAVHHDLVYVLNAGGDGSITGFRVRGDRLTPIAGSERSLGLGNATPPFFLDSPGQIGITDDGSELLVSTKTHGLVDAFALGADGRPATTPVATQTGPLPFAFTFDARGRLVLEDASGSANTYRVLRSGALTPTGTTVANDQQAPCWIVDARGYFYLSNTGSNTITGYAEAPDGQLSLLNPTGVTATTDGGPIDIAVSPDGSQLFELNGLAGDLGVYAVAPDGSLTHIDTIGGLPAFNGTNGMEGIAVT
jgi:6-phosphogluconolactonase (cycloisomerase 2 family)